MPKYYVNNFDTSPNNSNMCIMAGERVNPEGKPSEIGGNNCCVIHYGNSNYEGQLAFGFGKNTIARRNKNGSAEWSPWDYVALKSDLQQFPILYKNSGEKDFMTLQIPEQYSSIRTTIFMVLNDSASDYFIGIILLTNTKEISIEKFYGNRNTPRVTYSNHIITISELGKYCNITFVPSILRLS